MAGETHIISILFWNTANKSFQLDPSLVSRSGQKAGGSRGQPQPEVWGTFLGMGTGQAGTSARGWDPWPGGSRSCISGRAKARSSAGSSSPSQSSAPRCLGASAQGHHGEGATHSHTGSELAPSPGSQTSVSPRGCSHNPYSRAHHHSLLNNYFTKAAFLLCYG